MHKILFCNKFIIRLYMFQALCAHHQEFKTVLYSILLFQFPQFWLSDMPYLEGIWT